MAEETHNPHRIFPKVMLTGLGITAVIYVLVSICAVALIPVGELATSSTPLVLVVQRAAPGLPMDTIMPIISMFAVANSALINMMMASRLLYGMSRQGVLPTFLSLVHARNQTPWAAIVFTTILGLGLIILVSSSNSAAISALGGTTALLLLGVFTFVNIAVLILRKDHVEHEHFRANTLLSCLGAVVCLFLVTPLTGRDTIQYQVAGWLLALGVVMWGITILIHRKEPRQLDPATLNDE